MRACNICNGICLIILAIIVFLPVVPSTSPMTQGFTSITVAAYVAALGIFMCCVELNISLVQSRFRARCGFYYSYLGRAIMIFFSGTMAVALIAGGHSDTEFDFYYLVGGATCFNALFNLAVVLCHPSIAQDKASGVSLLADPFGKRRTLPDGTVTGTVTMEESMVAYLRANPELTVKAAGAGARAAASLPPHQRASVATAIFNPFRSSVAAPTGNGAPVVVQHSSASVAGSGRASTAPQPHAETTTRPPMYAPKQQSDTFHLGTSYRGADGENPFT